MAIPSRAELLALDVEARLELIEALWDSIADDPTVAATLPVDDDARALIDERLREHRADPAAVRQWSEVRDEILKRR
jgi:putative addiction module component (TIGR02574 family)